MGADGEGDYEDEDDDEVYIIYVVCFFPHPLMLAKVLSTVGSKNPGPAGRSFSWENSDETMCINKILDRIKKRLRKVPPFSIYWCYFPYVSITMRRRLRVPLCRTGCILPLPLLCIRSIYMSVAFSVLFLYDRCPFDPLYMTVTVSTLCI